MDVNTKGLGEEGVCKSLRRKGERGGAMDGHGADGVRAGEVRRKGDRGMGANVGVEDSRRGTRGQLAGRTVEGQVADFRKMTLPRKKKDPDVKPTSGAPGSYTTLRIDDY